MSGILNALFAHRAPQVMPTAMMPTAMQVMPTAMAVAVPVPESMGREDDAAAKLMKLKELFQSTVHTCLTSLTCPPRKLAGTVHPTGRTPSHPVSVPSVLSSDMA